MGWLVQSPVLLPLLLVLGKADTTHHSQAISSTSSVRSPSLSPGLEQQQLPRASLSPWRPGDKDEHQAFRPIIPDGDKTFQFYVYGRSGDLQKKVLSLQEVQDMLLVPGLCKEGDDGSNYFYSPSAVVSKLDAVGMNSLPSRPQGNVQGVVATVQQMVSSEVAQNSSDQSGESIDIPETILHNLLGSLPSHISTQWQFLSTFSPPQTTLPPITTAQDTELLATVTSFSGGEMTKYPGSLGEESATTESSTRWNSRLPSWSSAEEMNEGWAITNTDSEPTGDYHSSPDAVTANTEVPTDNDITNSETYGAPGQGSSGGDLSYADSHLNLGVQKLQNVNEDPLLLSLTDLYAQSYSSDYPPRPSASITTTKNSFNVVDTTGLTDVAGLTDTTAEDAPTTPFHDTFVDFANEVLQEHSQSSVSSDTGPMKTSIESQRPGDAENSPATYFTPIAYPPLITEDPSAADTTQLDGNATPSTVWFEPFPSTVLQGTPEQASISDITNNENLLTLDIRDPGDPQSPYDIIPIERLSATTTDLNDVPATTQVTISPYDGPTTLLQVLENRESIPESITDSSGNEVSESEGEQNALLRLDLPGESLNTTAEDPDNQYPNIRDMLTQYYSSTTTTTTTEEPSLLPQENSTWESTASSTASQMTSSTVLSTTSELSADTTESSPTTEPSQSATTSQSPADSHTLTGSEWSATSQSSATGSQLSVTSQSSQTQGVSQMPPSNSQTPPSDAQTSTDPQSPPSNPQIPGSQTPITASQALNSQTASKNPSPQQPPASDTTRPPPRLPDQAGYYSNQASVIPASQLAGSSYQDRIDLEALQVDGNLTEGDSFYDYYGSSVYLDNIPEEYYDYSVDSPPRPLLNDTGDLGFPDRNATSPYHDHHHHDHHGEHHHGEHHGDHHHNKEHHHLGSPENPAELLRAPADNPGLEATTEGLQTDIREFVDVMNDITFKVYKRAARQHRGRNFVMSPLSLVSTLGMLLLGARGVSSSALSELLHTQQFYTFNPHLVLKNVTQAVQELRDVHDIAFLSQFLVETEKNPYSTDFFARAIKVFYNAVIEDAAPSELEGRVRETVNAVVSNRTKGRVDPFLSEEEKLFLTPPLTTVATSFLHARWSQPVQQQDLLDMSFIRFPTAQRRLISTVGLRKKMTINAGFSREAEATSAEIPLYSRSGELSLVLVMPGEQKNFVANGLTRLESTLTPKKWSRILRSMLPNTVHLKMPVFRHRAFHNFSTILSDLGLGQLFMEGEADFSGINHIRNLHLSDVVQLTEFQSCQIEDASSSQAAGGVRSRMERSNMGENENGDLHFHPTYIYGLPMMEYLQKDKVKNNRMEPDKKMQGVFVNPLVNSGAKTDTSRESERDTRDPTARRSDLPEHQLAPSSDHLLYKSSPATEHTEHKLQTTKNNVDKSQTPPPNVSDNADKQQHHYQQQLSNEQTNPPPYPDYYDYHDYEYPTDAYRNDPHYAYDTDYRVDKMGVATDGGASAGLHYRQSDVGTLAFDRAFLYAVRHNPTGLLLFLGRYLDPEGH